MKSAKRHYRGLPRQRVKWSACWNSEISLYLQDKLNKTLRETKALHEEMKDSKPHHRIRAI